MRISVDCLRTARMKRDYHADATGFCQEGDTCVQHPALTRITRFPRGRGKPPKGVEFGTFWFVDGALVEGGFDAIAAELTEHYRIDGGRPVFDHDAEMDEAGEP